MNHCDRILFTTHDSEHDVPALTTLLYKVCDQDKGKFEEACRLIELFVNKALEQK